jgi:hypothetical protein
MHMDPLPPDSSTQKHVPRHVSLSSEHLYVSPKIGSRGDHLDDPREALLYCSLPQARFSSFLYALERTLVHLSAPPTELLHTLPRE